MAFMRTGSVHEMTDGLNEVGSHEDLYQENNDLDQLWIASIDIEDGKREGRMYHSDPINGGKIIHLLPLMLVSPLKSLSCNMKEREGRCIIVRPSIKPK